MNRLYEPPGEAELVEEYLRLPKGPHSLELMGLIKALQANRAGQGTIIVNLVPFKLWALASLPEDRSMRVSIERDRLFETEDGASRALFEATCIAARGVGA
ncbi:MAG: hypothetical protein JWL86_274 [Rhizobium sp.]|nr:hypothetical protein [Rhizobium sp.]